MIKFKLYKYPQSAIKKEKFSFMHSDKYEKLRPFEDTITNKKIIIYKLFFIFFPKDLFF